MSQPAGSQPTRALRVLSLCTGIGGLDLAAEWAGMEVIGQVEIDEYCRAVLAKHWPRVKRLRDLREVVGDEFGTVDMLVAGFPCQPTSLAGQRRGASDDRWLWPEVYRVIRAARPAWAVLENVPGLISMGLDGILDDLAASGYEAWPLVFPAAAVGAPHLRERVFIVAHCHQHRGRWAQRTDAGQCGRADVAHPACLTAGSAHEQANALADGGTAWALSVGGSASSHVADAAPRGPRRRTAPGQDRLAAQPDESAGWRKPLADAPSDARQYQQGGRARIRDESAVNGAQGHLDWKTGHAQPVVGRELDGLSHRLDGTARYQWPAGPHEPQHAWEAPRVTHERIPNRAARLKALGNAVVPQQAVVLFEAIADIADRTVA